MFCKETAREEILGLLTDGTDWTLPDLVAAVEATDQHGLAIPLTSKQKGWLIDELDAMDDAGLINYAEDGTITAT